MSKENKKREDDLELMELLCQCPECNGRKQNRLAESERRIEKLEAQLEMVAKYHGTK